MRQKREVKEGLPPSIRSSKSVFQVMLLPSLALHGLLLTIPIPAEQPLAKQQEKKINNLVTIKPVALPPAKPSAASPSPTVVQTPLPQPAKVAPRPNPIIQAAIPPQGSAEVNPPADVPPQRSAEVTPSASPQPLVSETPTIQATPAPSPSPTPSPVASPANLGIVDINGIPVDAGWQPVEQPAQALTEPDLFLQADNQLHPDIVGPIAQVSGNNPDELFEKYYQQKLESANFTVEPSGSYVSGGGLYKLTRGDLTSPMYLTLAPTKDGTGTVVTIWKNYPQPAT